MSTHLESLSTRYALSCPVRYSFILRQRANRSFVDIGLTKGQANGPRRRRCDKGHSRKDLRLGSLILSGTP